MVESNGEDVQWPWFSGICLKGEVAGQYEMDLASSPQEPEPGVLALDGLAPITIFVGANNSGKSRLLRELFRLEQAHMTKLGTRKSEDAYEKDEANAIDIGGSVESWLENLRPDSQLEIQDGWIPELSRQKIDEQLRSPQTFRKPYDTPKWNESISRLNRCGIKDKLPAVQSKKRCYVPMLRGMRPPTHKQYCAPKTEEYGDLYKQRTVYDYFHGQSDLDGDTPRSIIFTGLGLYGDLRSRLLAKTQTIRDSVRKYELFLSKYFFAGKEVILIPVEEGNNDVVHIRIGNNDERPIYDLGDGMQSLIICTYPIVTETEQGALFFLEEPDLCMHPSLQRTFLEVLKIYHRKMGHQFFITTHSNHLLDLLEDNDLVSIFSFSEIAVETPISNGHLENC